MHCNALDPRRTVALYRHFSGRIASCFGIGAKLTNNGPQGAVNAVMKIVACSGQPAAKPSDSPGKTLCKDEDYLANVRAVFSQTDS